MKLWQQKLIDIWEPLTSTTSQDFRSHGPQCLRKNQVLNVFLRSPLLGPSVCQDKIILEGLKGVNCIGQLDFSHEGEWIKSC